MSKPDFSPLALLIGAGLVLLIGVGLGLYLAETFRWSGQGLQYRPAHYFADGARYSGPLNNANLAEGDGRMEWPNGDQYVGEFQDGMMHGDGVYTNDNGGRYTGEFRRGRYHGEGVFTTADGTRYEGEFVQDSFTGKGTVTFPDGRSHAGEFQDWVATGPGVQTDAAGNQYRGEFTNGYLDGEGEYIGIDGERYEGEFRYGQYSGQGELWTADGQHYKGAFRNGRMHGEGRWSGQDGAEHVTFSGRWRNGELIAADEGITVQAPQAIAEHTLYQQQPLLQDTLSAVQPGDPSTIDLFTLAAATYGSEEVFRREINYIEQDFDRRFNNAGFSVYLSNSRRHLDDRPLATLTSLEKSLQRIGEQMNSNQDILFLYLTSHGWRDRTIAIDQPGLELPDLSASHLRELLEASGIKWRVIVLSACYSGGFIEDLRDDHTLVVTAAAADKQSFGCSDNSRFTYFGEAFFKEALPQSASFVEAFARADKVIEQWEQRENKERSLPQLVSGESILQQLERWRAQKAHEQP